MGVVVVVESVESVGVETAGEESVGVESVGVESVGAVASRESEESEGSVKKPRKISERAAGSGGRSPTEGVSSTTGMGSADMVVRARRRERERERENVESDNEERRGRRSHEMRSRERWSDATGQHNNRHKQ
jgi:hypothetical protein